MGSLWTHVPCGRHGSVSCGLNVGCGHEKRGDPTHEREVRECCNSKHIGHFEKILVAVAPRDESGLHAVAGLRPPPWIAERE